MGESDVTDFIRLLVPTAAKNSPDLTSTMLLNRLKLNIDQARKSRTAGRDCSSIKAEEITGLPAWLYIQTQPRRIITFFETLCVVL